MAIRLLRRSFWIVAPHASLCWELVIYVRWQHDIAGDCCGAVAILAIIKAPGDAGIFLTNRIMKIGELASFGHNVADSLASGICLMVGIYSVNIYREASASPEGHIVVDFMTGTTSGSPVSADLGRAIQRFSERLPEFAAGHGLNLSEIKVLSARFGTDPVAGPHFCVTVETSDGRRSVDQYAGVPGRRFSKSKRKGRAA